MGRTYRTLEQGEAAAAAPPQIDLPADVVAQQLGRQLLRILELQQRCQQLQIEKQQLADANQTLSQELQKLAAPGGAD